MKKVKAVGSFLTKRSRAGLVTSDKDSLLVSFEDEYKLLQEDQEDLKEASRSVRSFVLAAQHHSTSMAQAIVKVGRLSGVAGTNITQRLSNSSYMRGQATFHEQMHGVEALLSSKTEQIDGIEQRYKERERLVKAYHQEVQKMVESNTKVKLAKATAAMEKIEKEIEPLTRSLKAMFDEMQQERDDAFGGAITRFNNVLVRSMRGMATALSGLCDPPSSDSSSGAMAATASGRADSESGTAAYDMMSDKEQGVSFRLKARNTAPSMVPEGDEEGGGGRGMRSSTGSSVGGGSATVYAPPSHPPGGGSGGGGSGGGGGNPFSGWSSEVEHRRPSEATSDEGGTGGSSEGTSRRGNSDRPAAVVNSGSSMPPPPPSGHSYMHTTGRATGGARVSVVNLGEVRAGGRPSNTALELKFEASDQFSGSVDGGSSVLTSPKSAGGFRIGGTEGIDWSGQGGAQG